MKDHEDLRYSPDCLVVEMGPEQGGQCVLIEADVGWLDWGEINLGDGGEGSDHRLGWHIPRMRDVPKGEPQRRTNGERPAAPHPMAAPQASAPGKVPASRLRNFPNKQT